MGTSIRLGHFKSKPWGFSSLNYLVKFILVALTVVLYESLRRPFVKTLNTKFVIKDKLFLTQNGNAAFFGWSCELLLASFRLPLSTFHTCFLKKMYRAYANV